jgi:acyl-coenzyme A thioesterase PaaI-like protein
MTARSELGEPDFTPPATTGVLVELANSTRRLMDAVALTAADEATLHSIVAEIDATASRLEDAGLRSGTPWPPIEDMGRGDRPHNPVAGPANPLSPPMLVRVSEGGELHSDITMRPIHEGPPGGVHGGFVAALLDQLLGAANIVYGVGAMTAELTIRYRRPTPIGVPLELRARTESVEGRKVHTTGEIIADGVVTAEARGLFIRPTAERLERHQEIARERRRPK